MWPRDRAVPVGWPHLDTNAMAITKVIFSSGAYLHPSKQITTNQSAKAGRFRFGVYIEDNIVLRTDGRKITKMYDRVYSAFSRRKLRSSHSKFVRLSKNLVEVLEAESTPIGMSEPSPVKMSKLLDATHALFNEVY